MKKERTEDDGKVDWSHFVDGAPLGNFLEVIQQIEQCILKKITCND